MRSISFCSTRSVAKITGENGAGGGWRSAQSVSKNRVLLFRMVYTLGPFHLTGK